MIRRIYIYISLSVCIHLSATAAGYGQGFGDSTGAAEQEDSIEARLDSLSGYLSGNEYDEPYQDTLYFSGKEHPGSLYDSSPVKNRFVPDSITQNLKNDNAFWYANEDRHVQNKKIESNSFWEKFWEAVFTMLRSPLFRQIMWMLMITLFAAAVIWFLVQNKMNIFGSGKKVILPVHAEKDDADNIFTANLREAAVKAAEKGDYRLAIRFSYLQLLKTFSENRLISYGTDTTNSQYLDQLYSQPCYKDFFNVTRSYEYAWYGEMPVTRQQYETVLNDFSSLYQKAGLPV
ncbi:hypothetical protein [Agriterribacter sp.]|uniref:hypothetical protein n=1 Tax=Agriterribacter sp. TaxID=2821509 RepID=UPI002C7EE14B|nr:hypothetical protein [Agriterribacter sp.]HRP58562.1 hypothetical protein [Agriterribacter sp.]